MAGLDKKAHHILVVDDEVNIAHSLNFLMEKVGYSVRIAADGEQAIEAIKEARPDLILLDINMPGLNGYQVCEMVRADPEWKDILIVMLTAKGRDIEREKGLAVGADDYITKPFSTQEVIDKVRGMLEGGNE
jgi:two-component system, OmpR family, alkaline phosphatase synthesis response regulator PhoP